MTWAAVGVAGVGAASSLMGASKAASAAKQQAKIAKNQIAIAGTAYSPINVTGPGGGGVNFTSGGGGAATGTGTGGSVKGITDLGNGFRQVGKYGLQSNITGINASLGDLNPIRDSIVNSAGQLGGNLGLQGLSPLQSLGLGLAGQGAAGPNMDLGTLQSLQGLYGNTTGQQYNQYFNQANNPFQAGLQNQLFQGAQGQFQDAAQGFDQYRQQTLDQLRQQAQPFEDRAFGNLQQNLFSTGRMGSTGGGLQTEAFARGLGQADLQRQLQAGGEARNAQSQSLSVGSGLANQGSSIQSLQDQLLNGAFNRFGQSSQFAQGLSQDIYNRTLGSSQFGINAGNGLFNLGQNAQLNPYTVQQGALNNLGAFLGQTQNLQQQAYAPVQLANTIMGNQANARTGQAGAVGDNIGALSGQQNMQASAFSQLGGALLGSQAGQKGIGAVFGGIKNLFGQTGNGQTDGLGGLQESLNRGLN